MLKYRERMSVGSSCQDDDWMVKALKSYENLYMFELPQPTCCIEWSQQDTAIFVAGTSPDVSSEICQLALPDKLLPTNTETHWAGGKRDFRLISGAFISYPVKAMKYLPTQDMLASAGDKPFITLWTTDKHNSDCLIQSAQLDLHLRDLFRNKDTQTFTFIDASVEQDARLLTGSSLGLATVQILDSTTGKPCFTLRESPKYIHLYGLSYVTTATDLIVTSSGQHGDVDIWDTRMGGVKPVSGVTVDPDNKSTVVEPPAPDRPQAAALMSHRETPSHSFGFAVSHEPYPATKVAVLNGSSSTVQLFDCRQPRVMCASCDTSEGGRTVTNNWFRRASQTPCVKFGPMNSNLLSVSGCTPGVKVYDTTSWNCASGVATPLFTHTGHEDESPSAQILVHNWQPGSQSILSADREGSLHAWQWKT